MHRCPRCEQELDTLPHSGLCAQCEYALDFPFGECQWCDEPAVSKAGLCAKPECASIDRSYDEHMNSQGQIRWAD